MSKMDEDDLDDAFVIEREVAEPLSTGFLLGTPRLSELPPELESQIKATLKALKKMDAGLFSEKRKRDQVLYSVIVTALKARLDQYATTVGEDEALLLGDGISQRQRLAIQVRLGEKRLLQEALDHLAQLGGEADGPSGQDGQTKKTKS